MLYLNDQETKDLYDWVTKLTMEDDHEDVDMLEDDDDSLSLYSDDLR